jgi:hypothetical protein
MTDENAEKPSGTLRNLADKVRSEPLALISLLVTISFGVLNSNWFWRLFEGGLDVKIATAKDVVGRCADIEAIIENNANQVLTNIRAPVNVDYMTRRGDVSLEYGSLTDMFIAPAEVTKLPRRAGDAPPVDYSFDTKSLVLSIPRLNPGEWLHVVFGESGSGMENQRAQIRRGAAEFMNVPRFSMVNHDQGRARVRYLVSGGCSRD